MVKEKKDARIVNRKAWFEYEILDTLEAGMVLLGSEVKSLRLGRASLQDSFIQVRDGEAFVVNMHIPKYEFADNRDYDERRTRKLLLHKKQIVLLDQKTDGANLTIVPLEVYRGRNNYKMKIAVAKGRQQHSKRAVLRERDIKRQTQADMRGKY